MEALSKRRTIGRGLVFSMLALAGLTGSTAALSAMAEDTPSSIVEDFRYPGTAGILARDNVKLISGDGYIVYADCATPPVRDVGVIKVYTTELVGVDGAGEVCFKVLAAS